LPGFRSCRLAYRPQPACRGRGSDYHFLSDEEFRRRREQGHFLEACEVFGSGHWYGTLESEVTPSLASGKWVVLEIDVEGTQNVLKRYPEAITIFVRPSSLAELERRLRSRGTESVAAIERRLAVARRELECQDRYQYQVINDDVEQAVQQICEILIRAGAVND
jgi:guanylate kinase